MTAPLVVLAPDKFKSSLTASEVAQHLATGLARARPDVRIVSVPVADGGDGTVAAALAAGFSPVTCTVGGPLGHPVDAVFGLGDGSGLGEPGVRVAVVELATASGLGALPSRDGRPQRDALRASSRGTGHLVRAALDAGAEVVVLGVGGSACTDGGAGMLAALGAALTDRGGAPLPDGGGALVDLATVDLAGLDPRVATTRFVLASDVDHPLLGSHGAAAVFGPQKGATPTQVRVLERGLRRWVELVETAHPEASGVERAAGAGAAGGVGYAALAVLHAAMRPGIELVLDLVGLDQEVTGADLVVTGEGSLDEQSLRGKAPVGVAGLAARHGVRAVAVCGRSSLTSAQAAEGGFAAVYALIDDEPDLGRCLSNPGPVLERVGERVAAQLGEVRDALATP